MLAVPFNGSLPCHQFCHFWKAMGAGQKQYTFPPQLPITSRTSVPPGDDCSMNCGGLLGAPMMAPWHSLLFSLAALLAHHAGGEQLEAEWGNCGVQLHG